MDTDHFTFKASRWTRGNHIFRTIIEITGNAIIRHRRNLFHRDEISISLSKVASVHIKTGFFFSDIIIESTGGTDPLLSHGHTKGDAHRIKDLVMNAQGFFAATEKIKLS